MKSRKGFISISISSRLDTEIDLSLLSFVKLFGHISASTKSTLHDEIRFRIDKNRVNMACPASMKPIFFYSQVLVHCMLL